MDRLLVIVFWPMKKMTEKANKLGGIGLKLIYEFLPKKLIFSDSITTIYHYMKNGIFFMFHFEHISLTLHAY